MPRDADIGRDLATAIDSTTFSSPQQAEFRYDQFIENDKVDETRIRVSVELDERNQEARSAKYWHRSCNISVIMLAPQQANTDAVTDAEAEIDALLDLWDEVLDFIQTQVPQGHRPTRIESIGSRFDKDKLQDDRQFRAGVMVEYRLI